MSEGTEDLENILNEAAGVETKPKPKAQPVPETAPQQARENNAVFADQAPVKYMTQEEYVRRELGFEIGVDAVPLPSRGLLYPEGHPLHKAEHVEYKAMTTKEENILLSPALIKKGTMIKELIKSSLMNKDIDVETLVSGDRTALLIAIRSSGYDEVYSPTVNCPRCEAENEMHINLNELDILPLNLDPVVPGENLFEFVLPRTQKVVRFKFLTVGEEEREAQEQELRKKRGLANQQAVTTRLNSTIVSVDGDTNRSNIIRFVEHMPAKDSRALRQYIQKHEPGVQSEVEFVCRECDHVGNIALPIDSEFFWPKAETGTD